MLCNITKKKKKSNELQIFIQGKKINKVNEYKYLGIIIDSNLKFQAHIKSIINRLKSVSAVFYKIKRVIPLSVKKNIYYALVHSVLVYGIVVWGNAYDAHLKELDMIQKRICKSLLNIKNSEELVR